MSNEFNLTAQEPPAPYRSCSNSTKDKHMKFLSRPNSDLQGLDDEYLDLSAQREWDSRLRQIAPTPSWWYSAALLGVTVVIASAVCLVAYVWFS